MSCSNHIKLKKIYQVCYTIFSSFSLFAGENRSIEITVVPKLRSVGDISATKKESTICRVTRFLLNKMSKLMNLPFYLNSRHSAEIFKMPQQRIYKINILKKIKNSGKKIFCPNFSRANFSRIFQSKP